MSLTLATIGSGILRSCVAPVTMERAETAFQSPTLALELARTAGDARRLIEQNRRGFLVGTSAHFLFIGAYAALWWRLARGRASVAAPLVIIAAVSDAAGHAAMLASAASGATSLSVGFTRDVSLLKWAALGVVWVSLPAVFRPRPGVRGGWEAVRVLIGLSYAYAGVLALLGVLVFEPFIERHLAPLCVALVLQGFVLLHDGLGTVSGSLATRGREMTHPRPSKHVQTVRECERRLEYFS